MLFSYVCMCAGKYIEVSRRWMQEVTSDIHNFIVVFMFQTQIHSSTVNFSFGTRAKKSTKLVQMCPSAWSILFRCPPSPHLGTDLLLRPPPSKLPHRPQLWTWTITMAIVKKSNIQSCLHSKWHSTNNEQMFITKLKMCSRSSWTAVQQNRKMIAVGMKNWIEVEYNRTSYT